MLLRSEIFLLPEDVETLRPRCLVNGLVINGYMRLIERRSCYYRHLPSVWACDSSFRSDWVRGGYEATKWRLRQVDPFSRELLLFPIHLPNVGQHGHWSLVAVWPRRAEIASFDSLGQRQTAATQQMEYVLEFLRLHAQAKNLPFDGDGWALTRTPENCPRQEDTDSCGVFVCVFADRLARGKDVCRPIDVNTARSTIAEILKRGRFDREDFADYKNVNPAPQSPVAVIDLSSPGDSVEGTAPATGIAKVDEEVAGEDGESTTRADAEAAESARAVGDEVSAMELDNLLGEEAPQVRAAASVGGSLGEEQMACLTLTDGELEGEFAAEPALESLVSESLATPAPDSVSRQRSHRRPEVRREERRRAERRSREAARERVRREKDRSGRKPRAPQEQLARGPARDTRRRDGPPGREDERRPVSHRDHRDGGRRNYRRQDPSSARSGATGRPRDLRDKLNARRGEQRRESPRPDRRIRMTLTVERRFDRTVRQEEPPRRSKAAEKTREASGRRSFGVPKHLRDRLAELEDSGWSRKDRRNKRWVVTREDGSKFKIRAAKLKTLSELY